MELVEIEKTFVNTDVDMFYLNDKMPFGLATFHNTRILYSKLVSNYYNYLGDTVVDFF